MHPQGLHYTTSQAIVFSAAKTALNTFSVVSAEQVAALLAEREPPIAATISRVEEELRKLCAAGELTAVETPSSAASGVSYRLPVTRNSPNQKIDESIPWRRVFFAYSQGRLNDYLRDLMSVADEPEDWQQFLREWMKGHEEPERLNTEAPIQMLDRAMQLLSTTTSGMLADVPLDELIFVAAVLADVQETIRLHLYDLAAHSS